jgi:hypothetical protein
MPSSKTQGMVAGRTAYQIESAKRKAIGGKKKRCKKGKSCSATCIAANKVCLVDIPWVSAQGIPKVVSEIQKVSKTAEKSITKSDKGSALDPSLERFVKEEYQKKWTEALEGMVAANKNGDKKAYDSHKKKISDLYAKVTNKGVDVEPPKILKWGGDKVEVASSTKPSGKPDKKRISPSLMADAQYMYKTEEKKAWDKMNQAIIQNEKWRYNQLKEELLKYHTKMVNNGIELGKFRVPEWVDKETERIPVKPEPSVMPTKSSKKPAGLSDVEWDVIQKTERDFKEEIRYSVKNGLFKKIYSDTRDRIIAFNKKLKDEGVPYQIKVPPTGERMRQLSEAYDKRENAILNKLNDAISKGDKAAFDKDKLELQKLYNRLGKTLGKPDKTPDVPWATKIDPKDIVVAKGKMPLPKMNTEEQFKETVKKTEHNVDTKAIEFQNRAKQILDVYNSSDPKAEAVRDEIIQKLGGRKAFDAAITTIKGFTGSDYELIREAQHKAMKGEPLDMVQKERLAVANRVQALLSLMPKESIIKFRGIRVDQDTLNNIIESANMKGKFVDGGLASWSTALSVAAKFANMTTWDKNNRVIFRAVNKHGVGVEGITSITREMEVLTPGTTNYTHTGRYRFFKYGGETYHVFDVIEG